MIIVKVAIKVIFFIKQAVIRYVLLVYTEITLMLIILYVKIVMKLVNLVLHLVKQTVFLVQMVNSQIATLHVKNVTLNVYYAQEDHLHRVRSALLNIIFMEQSAQTIVLISFLITNSKKLALIVMYTVKYVVVRPYKNVLNVLIKNIMMLFKKSVFHVIKVVMFALVKQ